MDAQDFLGPKKEEGPIADPLLKIHTFLAHLCMSTLTPLLHDTPTLCIMERVNTTMIFV